MTIESLPWDSDFFGLKVGRCLLNDTDSWDEEKLAEWDLIYFFIQPGHQLANLRMRSCNIPIVDEKVTFVMDLEMHKKENTLIPGVYSYRKDTNVEEVINIGIQSGVYSRFYIDKKIPVNKFKELYTIWMQRSIDREIAEEVFVYKTGDGEIAGVITLGVKNMRADIGILAVDEKLRGLNIGKKLVSAAIRNSIENGYKILQVVTQKDNKAACHFYEQCGFTEEQVVNVYHYWS